jgi:flagellar biosynthesis/type III secretory pathway protein FliH
MSMMREPLLGVSSDHASRLPCFPSSQKSSTALRFTLTSKPFIAAVVLRRRLSSAPSSTEIAQVAKMSQSSIKPSTIAAISIGTIVTGFLAYAVYFDHRRRNDPEFRKQLKRESKKQARAAKEDAEASNKEQKKAIRDAVALANEEGFPKDPEEVERYFMNEVAQGEGLVQQGTWMVHSA